MPAVIPFIPLIAAGVSAGAQMYTQHKGADTAKAIANTQATAAGAATAAQTGQLDKALSLQQAMYQQNNASLQPWVTQGTSAVNTMGNLMGLGGMAGASAPAPAATPLTLPTTISTPTTGKSAWDTMSPEEQAYVSAPSTRRQLKNYLLTGDDALDPSQTGLFASDAQAAAKAQTQSGYTKMKAPDGTVQDIPSEYVNHYTQLGAQAIH